MKGMMAFHTLFQEIGVNETKGATLPGGGYGVPPGSYGFLEFYCTDPECKCRRVLINVISERQRAHLATINHAFEPPAPGSFTPEQTFLDPLNPQSDFSKALLLLFTEVLRRDCAYARRLVHHYQMVKDALSDPSHTIHAIVASGINESAVRASSQASIDPYESCPCGSGKKFKWCCRDQEGAVMEGQYNLMNCPNVHGKDERNGKTLKKCTLSLWQRQKVQEVLFAS